MSLTAYQTKLLSEYRKLSIFDQQLLSVISLLYFEINQTQMLACVNTPAFLSFGHGNNIKIPIIKEHLQKLKELSFLTLQEGFGYRCDPQIVEVITRESIKLGIFKVAAKAIEELAEKSYMLSGKEAFSLARIALYRGEINLFSGIEVILKKTKSYNSLSNYTFHPYQILSVLMNPFDIDFIKSFTFHENYFEIFFGTLLIEAVQKINPNPEPIDYLVNACKSSDKRLTPILIDQICEHLIFQGRYKEKEEIQKKYNKIDEMNFLLTDAISFFIQDKNEEAVSFFNTGINALKKNTNKRNYTFQSHRSLLYFFSLLKNGESENYQTAFEYAEKIAHDQKHPFNSSFQSLFSMCHYITGRETNTTKLHLGFLSSGSANFWKVFSFTISSFWVRPKDSKEYLPDLKRSLKEVQKLGYKWMEMQLLDLIAKIEKSDHSPALQLKQQLNSFFITDSIQKKEQWKLILNALSNIKTKSSPTSKDQTTAKRLAWFLRYDKKSQTCITIQPVEQSYTKGSWTEGKNIALKRLKNEATKILYLTEQDLKATSYIKAAAREYSYYGGSDYFLDPSVLIELVSHPFLFWMDTKSRLELERGEPELSVIENDDKTYKLILHPSKIDEDEKFALNLETPSKLKLIAFSPAHRQIAGILGKSGVNIPREAKDDILNAITSLSGSITIQSDIGGEGSQTEPVDALSTPYMHLLPAGSGLKLTVFCRPFSGEGPYYKPGKGGKNLIAEISGRKLRTTRNFEEEENKLYELLQLCPILNPIDRDSELEWILDDPETCLQALLELQIAGDKVIIEWPEGEKFRLTKRADTSKFHINIRKENDWFSVSGSLDMGNKEVMEMQTLLELLDQTPGRFLKMSDGSFMSLTDTFRKQLDELRAYSEPTKDGLRFSPLISPLLEEMTSEVASLKADKAWKTHVQKLEKLKEYKPELPNTFQATLRDYQLAGFEWLARLSHWGVGACLADDMGLGKTIQALAILLTRAAAGPSLVIAPSSVCMNWHSESLRFAPTLNTIQFGGKKREDLVKELNPFDLVVCSYGMIQQEEVAETLKSVNWQVIILDEAQAIKNMSTKRSQAVMNLKAGFRLLTTGTPIENHLGELWNLFKFLNPGLLGSLERFNERFAIPIEKYKDKGARNKLKNLIRPFILRRMKNEVLEELPEKTDITLQIELSEKEKAFYEALRLTAIKKLSDKDLPKGQKHLQILAEIMKLRRACCNTKLVEAKIDLPSSKFNAFTEILDELLENNHKALVFSQFVDHLSILKKYLEEKKIPFQYLDGSTPMKDRKKRVDAFQEGEGKVFLISLKAGGTGLNLTAADYVIHMDPWWNPAVEDQASDRSHRMGQKRPVTVYRLVAKDTIEAKIVDLHKHKRDLANSLLEETDMSGKISADELLNLLKANN